MNDLNQIIESTQAFALSSMGPLQILTSLSSTFIMSMFIYFIYKKTYNGVLYSQNFNITLVMTAIAINAIVIGISGNLMLSLGMVGALSIIRFRTAIKDPRDTAFILWAIMIAIANGVSFYELSLISSLFIAVVLWGLSRNVSFEPAYMLIIKHRDADAWQAVQALLNDRQLISSHVLRSDTHKAGMIEKVMEVKIKPGAQEALLGHIRQLPGVASSILLSSNGAFAE